MSPLIAFRKPVTFGPNVTGSTQPYVASTVPQNNGALIASSLYAFNINAISQAGAEAWSSLTFNANSSNAIYTDNGHVYQLSLALNYIIKA